MTEFIHPRRSEANIRVEQVGAELAIWNERNGSYHVLNAPAARVWHAADGSRSDRAIAAATGLSHEAVQLAVGDLHAAGLLEGDGQRLTTSRRVLLRRAAIAGAVALPVVSSITRAERAAAITCTADLNDPCDEPGGIFCCVGFCIGADGVGFCVIDG